MDREHGPGGRAPFLSSAEQADDDKAWTLLRAALRGDLLDRPDLDEDPAPPPAYDGEEWEGYLLAKHMGWSSQDLDDCPLYRRALWTQFMHEQNDAQNDLQERQQRSTPDGAQASQEQASSMIADAQARVAREG